MEECVEECTEKCTEKCAEKCMEKGHQGFVIDSEILFSNGLLAILNQLYVTDEALLKKRPIDSFFHLVSNSNAFEEDEVFLGALDFHTGISTECKLWNPRKKALVELNKYSAIKVDLEREKDLIQPFHLYAIRSIDSVLCQQKLSELFCDFAVNYISSYLDKCAPGIA